MLAVENLTIGYKSPRTPAHVVAEDINISLNEGEMVCLLGPNGAGKSTLIRTLAGMQLPLAGRVAIDGRDIHTMPARERAKRLSVVLTERVSAGLLSAYALVGLGRYPHTNWSGTLSDKDHEVIQTAIRMVGAEALMHRSVSELSDGERQKIMMARALAQEPRMMILDEITAFLDLPRRVEIMRLLRRLARTTGRAILLSTHDLDLALRSADRIWLLPNEGALQAGAPEDLVLNGAFEAAFASEGVDFDREHGSFRIHQRFEAEVELVGEGAALFWTRRALEREGLYVQESGQSAALRVEIVTEGTSRRWQLTHAGQTHTYDALYDLTRDVQSFSLTTRAAS